MKKCISGHGQAICQTESVAILVGYSCLFSVATGCPSERCPRRRLVVTGDSARIQEESTESCAWFFHLLGV